MCSSDLGIAVLVALSQIKDFLGLRIAKMPGDFFGIVSTGSHEGAVRRLHFQPRQLGR